MNDEDGGYTLVELLVVMVITGVIGGMVVTSFVGASRATARATARVDAMNDLRPAVERLTRDLRAASPVILDPAGNFDTSVGAQLERGGVVYEHRYELRDVAGVLELWQERDRVETDGTLTSIDAGSLVAQVENTAADPVFTYYDLDAQPITCAATAVSAEERSACRDEHLTASRIDIHVVRGTDGGRPIEFASSITIRNTRTG